MSGMKANTVIQWFLFCDSLQFLASGEGLKTGSSQTSSVFSCRTDGRGCKTARGWLQPEDDFPCGFFVGYDMGVVKL